MDIKKKRGGEKSYRSIRITKKRLRQSNILFEEMQFQIKNIGGCQKKKVSCGREG